MKKLVSIVLVALMALACVATAEGANVSITTGLPTNNPAHTIVVQMDNEPGARPQRGIASADIVYEVELYNGGYTRYTAVFNDTIPELIEAIRSARIVNADIYAEYNGVFVHFGGQKYEGSNVYDYFGTLNIGKRYDGIGGDKDFYRDSKRKAPNNVACKLQNLLNKTDWSNITCKSPLKFSAEPTIPGDATPATNVTVPYRNGYTPSYQWNGTCYNRLYNDKPFVDGNTNEQVTADNIIVQSVEYAWYSGESDRPKVTLTGTGKCDYFINGMHFTGTWQRDSISSNTVYKDAAGNEVQFKPGKTYIEVLKSEKAPEFN